MSSVTEMRAQVEALDQQVGRLEQHSLGVHKTLRMIEISIMALQKFSGGNKTLDDIIAKTQKMIMLFSRAYMLLGAIQEAELGMLGPVGWVFAGVNAVGLTMAATDFAMSGSG